MRSVLVALSNLDLSAKPIAPVTTLPARARRNGSSSATGA